MTILQQISNLALPTIFCLNKVDLISFKEIKLQLQKAHQLLDFARYMPIVPIVAQT